MNIGVAFRHITDIVPIIKEIIVQKRTLDERFIRKFHREKTGDFHAHNSDVNGMIIGRKASMLEKSAFNLHIFRFKNFATISIN